jgi:hypothetical protein
MLANGVREGGRLAGPEGREEVGARIVEPSHLHVLVCVTSSLHLPGPGEIVWILSKRFELPILEQPEPGYLATK